MSATDLNNELVMYYFCLSLLFATIWFVRYVIYSPFGQALKAIRDNEPRAISLGYDVQSYKLMAFVISAALAGFAGGLKAIVVSLAALTDVHWRMSGEVILMSLLGGLGTTLGPVFGAVVVVLLQTELAGIGVIEIGSISIDLSTKIPILIGVIFMLCVLLFRKGIVGEILYLFDRRSQKQKKRFVEPA